MAQAHRAIPTSSNNRRVGACFRSFELTMFKELFAYSAKRRAIWKEMTKEKACLLLSEGTLFFFYTELSLKVRCRWDYHRH